MSLPTFSLATLRDIGWSLWDPIGLSAGGGAWPANGVDEYDAYLLAAATQCQGGKTVSEVAEYLHSVAQGHMGLDQVDRENSTRAATAIAAYVASLR